MKIIEVCNLVMSYPLDGRALTILDIPAWSVDEGEQVALFGPSGCGKSTLLHVIAGLQAPTAGTVRVCGQELTTLGEAARDRFRGHRIGYVFQNFNLLQGYTALENVLVGMTFSHQKADRGAAEALLAEVGLAHRMRHYPAQMSIGEQQRVAIARALVKKPALILADEPTGSLDPRRSGDIVTSLQAACQKHGCSLLLVSHEPVVIAAFKRQVAFMDLNRAMATREVMA
jgi:putative ABC transport system ATP-binding protein